jgi:hypothetical protein
MIDGNTGRNNVANLNNIGTGEKYSDCFVKMFNERGFPTGPSTR